MGAGSARSPGVIRVLAGAGRPRWVGAALSIPGRVERNKWIQQAREILAHAEQGKESAP